MVTVRFKNGEEETFINDDVGDITKSVQQNRVIIFGTPDGGYRIYNLDSFESIIMEKYPDAEKVKE